MNTDDEMGAVIYEIAADVFTAMVDGEEGLLQQWHGDVVPAFTHPLYAWVDVDGPVRARTVVSAERSTCDALTRSLLGLPEDEVVDAGDLEDAFGEVANVVGGNIKSMVPDSGRMFPPVIADVEPGALEVHAMVPLEWRGELILISVTNPSEAEGLAS